jgi:hypothetical protein
MHYVATAPASSHCPQGDSRLDLLSVLGSKERQGLSGDGRDLKAIENLGRAHAPKPKTAALAASRLKLRNVQLGLDAVCRA